MYNHYKQSLNGSRLQKVYATENYRVKQYLAAEIDFVKNILTDDDEVLELGAGYGRIVKELAPHCLNIFGIDISPQNILFSHNYLKTIQNCRMFTMDVHNLKFHKKFDVILCLQNGLSSMNISFKNDIQSILELLKEDGKVIFSTYSENFWKTRLAWFEEQSSIGLLSSIDYNNTGDGIIRCMDGFESTSHTLKSLKELGTLSGFNFSITEVDNSSLFLVIKK